MVHGDVRVEGDFCSAFRDPSGSTHVRLVYWSPLCLLRGLRELAVVHVVLVLASVKLVFESSVAIHHF